MRTIATLAALLLIGCSPTKLAGGEQDGGGPTGDGGVDPVDAGPPGQVTIRVLEDGPGTPIAGARVLFVGPDGSLIADLTTEADGLAQAEVPPHSAAVALLGGQVGKGQESDTAYEGRAVLDVSPGDDIALGGDYLYNSRATPTSTMTVTVPVLDDNSSFIVRTPCGYFGGDSSSTITIAFYPGCEPDVFSLVAFATNPSRPTRSILAADVVRADGGTLDLRMFRPVVSETVTLTGVPSHVTYVQGQYAVGRHGAGAFATSELGSGFAEDPAAEATLTPEGIAQLDGAALALDVYSGQTGVGSQRLLGLRPGRIGDGVTVALDEQLLPWVGGTFVDTEARTFGWTQAGDQAWDATYIEAYWYKAGDPTSSYGYWRIIAPPGATGATLPPLLEELEGWFPSDVDSINASVWLMESSIFADWDAARRAGFTPKVNGEALLGAAEIPSTLRFALGGNVN